MIAILEKSEHNVDFHQIVDFVEASHIRYALTINPTVYVSHIRQFWSTARIKTTNKGTKILATVDELFENLALMGYNILPNQKFTFQKGFNEFSSNIATDVVCLATNRVYNFSKMIFDAMVRNVNNKGSKFLIYPRVNSPSFSGRTVPLFVTMLVTDGEGSGTPTEPHHTTSPETQQSPHNSPSSPLHQTKTTETVPTSSPTEIPTLRQYSRRAKRIAQSIALPTAADEPASLLRDDSQEEDFPTVFGLKVGQDRENIIKTSALPHDSTPNVTSFDADEGSMQHQLQELTDLCTRLQRQQTEMALKINAQDLEISNLKARIKFLEDKDGGGAETFGEEATIKGRSLETGEEASVEKSTERGSNDTEELVNVLTSMDATNIPTSRVQAVSVPPVTEIPTIGIPTNSGLVPTVSTIFTTASVVTPYSRRKGKEKMVESDTSKKKKLQEQIDVQVAREMEEQMAREDQRMNEQIARDAEIARIHAKEELKMMIDGLDRSNGVIARHLHEYEQAAADLTIGEKIELINELVKYQEHHAQILKYQAQQSKPLSKKQQREFYMSVLKSHSGWKTKHFRGKRMKRKGFKLEQESAKKMKTSEEVSEEDLKERMHLVPVEEVYVEALQVKHPIIVWEIHTEGKRDYRKIIRLGGHTTVYQFFVDMLKIFDREDLNQLWALVKETLSIRQASSDKEKELWVELKRLFEPDIEDQLWTHIQTLMHDPVEWKLYDTCGVHHVFTRDQDIFMLVERDYPLRKGLAIVMITNKLQVENYSQMANDLILKIHNIANSPR
nr:hypothetical protein [Tanacetum cinerariifolium]